MPRIPDQENNLRILVQIWISLTLSVQDVKMLNLHQFQLPFIFSGFLVLNFFMF